MDRRPRRPADLRALRRWQELARLGARQQGLPRQSLGALPARPTAVQRSGFGARRRPPPPAPPARHALREILEDRYGRRSTIVTSQLPVDQWHALIGDPTYADAVLDRLVHNAHRIDLNGEGLRGTRTPGRKA